MDISYTAFRHYTKFLQKKQAELCPSAKGRVTISIYIELESLYARVFFCGCQIEFRITPNRGDFVEAVIRGYKKLLTER